MAMHMPMGDHDTFWRDNQVTIVFRSDIPLISGDGILNKEPLIRKLNLPLQLQRLNDFLHENGVPVTLNFFSDTGQPGAYQSPPSQGDTMKEAGVGIDAALPPGVYLFSLTAPIQTSFGEVRTSVVSFLNFKQDAAHTIDKPVPTIVSTFNKGLEELNGNRAVPITIAAPVWLCGGTPGITQGCPLTAPIPVEDSCADWHIELPDLHSELQGATGKDVTVFILDAFPSQEVILGSANSAGDDNALLDKVNTTVTFDYSILSDAQDSSETTSPNAISVGKDVYGRHYATQMSDHGLFIAGIVRDIVPDATIACIRVLSDLCVGDMQLLTQALNRIYNRMTINQDTGAKGDLAGKRVVVNMSLVIPTAEEAGANEVTVDPNSSFSNVRASLFQPIKSLVDLGAIIVASAGNEGDIRESSGKKRPMALYPAAFGSPPDSLDGVIAVGAVGSDWQATPYSCYPGPRGIATYGGEVPEVQPSSPSASDPPRIIKIDALRGIYSSPQYPALSADSPSLYYDAPNDHAWAYWVGTSFATPIISAVAARVLELQPTGTPVSTIHDAIIGTAGQQKTQWDRLEPMISGIPGATTDGPVLQAVQQCRAEDQDS